MGEAESASQQHNKVRSPLLEAAAGSQRTRVRVAACDAAELEAIQLTARADSRAEQKLPLLSLPVMPLAQVGLHAAAELGSDHSMLRALPDPTV